MLCGGLLCLKLGGRNGSLSFGCLWQGRVREMEGGINQSRLLRKPLCPSICLTHPKRLAVVEVGLTGGLFRTKVAASYGTGLGKCKGI